MRTEYMSVDDARIAVEWMTERIQKQTGDETLRFPSGWMPETGLTALDDDDRIFAVAVLYLEKSSPVAVCGWCVSNPENKASESEMAVRMLMSAMVPYARSKGARHLLTMFGNRGINRILDDLGFFSGDKNVEHKYITL